MTEAAATRVYPQRPWVGVGAVVLHQGQVLLVRRGRPPGRGMWAFPGGVVRLGESVLAAARRELLEETGLDARPVDVVDVYEYIERDDAGRVRYHYVIVEVLLTPTGPTEVHAADDAAAAAWFPIAALQRPDVGPGVPRVVARALARLGPHPGEPASAPPDAGSSGGK